MPATRGPWLYDAGDSGDESVGMAPTPPAIYADPDNSGNVYPVCTMDDPRRKADRDPIDEYDDATETDGDISSNAALICAAPLLLAALREVIAAGENSVNPPDGDDVSAMLRFAKAIDDAENAISRAEAPL